MQKLFEKKAACFGCEACAAACPQKAVRMERDGEGFAYPVVDEALCTDCGLCAEVCPALHPLEKKACRAYAVRCSDLRTLYASTSGGAFSLIASRILKRGGLVCGAVFDETFKVVHRLSDDIAPMRKSKYVQSSLGGCFAELEEALRQGREVLFTGTPCQCHGIKRLYGKYPGLIIAALLCRGVQPPALWEEYTDYLREQGELTAFCFRDKRRADDAHTVSCTVGGTETAVSYNKDPFCRIYTKDLALRPSCYACPYCRPDKDFDFTIGDFWGIEKIRPELADGKGMSLVIAGSPYAVETMEELRGTDFVMDVTEEQAMQPALCESAKETMLRKFLFKDLAQKGPNGRCNMPMLLKKYGF